MTTSYSHPYLANSQKDIDEMLKFLGISSIDELFSDIPEDIKFKKELKHIPFFPSEFEVLEHISQLLSKNITVRDYRSFLGGGILDIYIPASQDELLRRTEFYSSYTPYQPEISQGMLQGIFEYQSMICELTEMEVSNASLYDWATAIGEAVLMVARINSKRTKVLYSAAIAPNRLAVLRNYVRGAEIELVEIPYDSSTGKTDIKKAKELLDTSIAGVYFENPNYFGIIEDDIFELIELAKSKEIMTIAGVDLSSLGLLEAPGSYGVDVVVGEGQCIGGGTTNFGGPLLGVLAMKMDKKGIRQMPGRIVGQTSTSREGEVAYVNTLQTREQHIKREKATSNICTNQALIALSAAIHLSLLGPKGLKETGESMYHNAHYLASEFEKIGIKRRFTSDFFNAFVLDLAIPATERFEFLNYMLEKQIFPGIPVFRDNDTVDYLITTSYLLKKKDLDDFVEAMKEWRKA